MVTAKVCEGLWGLWAAKEGVTAKVCEGLRGLWGASEEGHGEGM